MRTLLKILLLSMVCFSVKAQSPLGLPSPNAPFAYYNIGWLRADSGIINAVRDTSLRPLFIGTEIVWLHAGVDTAKWIWFGRWVKEGIGSLSGTSPIVYNPLTGNISCPTCGTGSGINQLNGDGTAGPGSGLQPFTLATVNATTGSFGDASHSSEFTANGKGLITLAGQVSIQIAESQVTNLVSDLASKQGIISTGSTSQYFRGDLSLATFPTNLSAFTNGPGYITTITGIAAGGALTGTYPNPTLASTITAGTCTNCALTYNAAGQITVASSGSGGGALTGGGGLTPLFTNGVSGSTLTFSLSNAGANTVFGNLTGSTAAPSYSVPTISNLNTWSGGSIALLGVANTWTAVQTMPAPIFNSLTSSGANDSVLTVDPATGKVHWRFGTFTIGAVNGVSMLGTTNDSLGLCQGCRLFQGVNISGSNANYFILDSMQAKSSSGFKVNFGSDAGWDMIVKDSATGYWTRIAKGSVGQSLQMLGSGGVGWANQSGGGGTIGGSIALNQVAVGSGANAISGSSGLTFSSNALNVYSIVDTRNQFLYDTIRTSGVAFMMTGLGNSITFGDNAVPLTEGYFFLLDSTYGALPYSNFGVPGSGAWMSTNKAYININPGHQSLTTWMAGYNNARVNGGGASILTTRDITNGLNAVICNQFNKAVINAWNGIGVTFTGSVTQYNGTSFGGKSLTNGATSAAAGDTVAYAFHDSTVFVAGFGADSSSSPFFFSENIQFIIDGTPVLTASEDNQASGIDPSGDSYNNRIVPMTWHFTGLTYANHVIKVVNKTAHSYPMNLDYFGNFVSYRAAMPIIAFEIPKMNAAGYAIAGFTAASNAVMNALNASIDSTIALYPIGMPIFIAKTNNFYNTSTDVSADNIHPTNQGHVHIMNAALAVLPAANTFGVSYGALTPGTVDYSGYKHAFSDSSGIQLMVTQAGLARDKYNIGSPGYLNDFLYNKSGSVAAWTKMYADTINHALILNMTPLIAGNQNPATGLLLTDTTAAITSQFRNSPTLVLGANQWNSTSGTSQPFDFEIFALGHTGATIRQDLTWQYRNNGGAPVVFMIYEPGVGLGLNTNAAGIAGTFENYQIASASYGTMTRELGGGHFLNIGVNTSHLGAISTDGTLSAATATTIDASGNWIYKGSLTFAAPTTTLASVNFPSGTAKTSPAQGDMFYDGTHLYFKPSGTLVDLLAGGGGFTNPMTSVGDIIIGGTAGAATRLAQGSNGTFLGVSGGVLGYYTPAGGGSAPGGSNYTLQYYVNGALGGATPLQFDTTNAGLDILSPSLGGNQVNGSGLLLKNATAAATNGFQYSPSLVFEGQGWNTTGANSQTFRAYEVLKTKSGATNGASLEIGYQNNNTTDVAAFTFVMGPSNNTSFGINQILSGIAGVLDAQQPASASYGLLCRLNGNSHFVNLVTKSTTIGALAFDNTASSAAALNFDISGDLMAPGALQGGTQTEAGNAWLEAAAGTTTRAGLYLAGSTDPTSPQNGMMSYSSSAHTLNFRDNGAWVNLLSNFYIADGTLSSNRTVNGSGTASLTLGGSGSQLTSLTINSTGGVVINSQAIAIGGATYTSANALSLPASTSTLASLNFANGTDPTSPNNGSIWYNNVNLWFNQSGTKKDMIPTKAEADFTGLTANTVLATFTPAAAGTYRVGGYITITAISVDVLQLQVTWTDETNNSRTLALIPIGGTVNLSTTGVYSFSTADIRVKSGTVVNVQAQLTTGTGSITFDGGGSIQIVQ